MWSVFYFRASSIAFNEDAHNSVIFVQLPDFTTSFGKRLLPIPTHDAPAPNQPFRFSSSGLTPPVTRICVHGIGALTPFTKAVPSTSPGKTLQMSQLSRLGISDFRHGTASGDIRQATTVADVGNFRIEKRTHDEVRALLYIQCRRRGVDDGPCSDNHFR